MEGQNDEIRLTDLLYAIVKQRRMIAFCAAAGLIIGMVISFVSFAMGEVAGEYKVTATIAVTSQSEDGLFVSQSARPSAADVHLAEDMVDAVIYVLKSDMLLNAAIDRVGLLGIPAQNISKQLVLSQYRQTQIIDIVLYWRNADEGVQILTAINETAPEVLAETLKIGNVAVVNEPMAKFRVGGTLNMRTWFFAALIGAAGGAGIAVLLMLLFPTLVEPTDVEKYLHLKLMGEIPAVERFFEKRLSPLSEEADRMGAAARDSYDASAHYLAASLGPGPHCLYITSAGPGEGRTVTAANLAVQLAAQEYRVLLVDLDVCNPSLGTLFLKSVPYERSLNALYRGDAQAGAVVHHLNGRLDLVPGILEERVLPLDDALLGLVRELMQDYDYVILDTPPAGQNAKTMNINRLTADAVLAVRFDGMLLSELEAACGRLRRGGTNLLGCVVCNVSQAGNKLLRLGNNTKKQMNPPQSGGKGAV